MRALVLGFISVLAFLFQEGNTDQIQADTTESAQFTIQTGITPTPPLSFVQTGFTDTQSAKPLRLTVSQDFLDYGPISPTNPIKRQLTISIDPGSSQGYRLFTMQNHPLSLDGTNIADTTCDDGSCTEKVPSIWINPLTFGLGFSFDDVVYQQFPDRSRNEAMVTIPSGKMTAKLNVNQTQPLPEDLHYEHTITFLALPNF